MIAGQAHGSPRIVHWWACADRRVVEVAERDDLGHGRVYRRCIGCGATDEPELDDDGPEAA